VSEPRNVTPGADTRTTDEQFRRRYFSEREEGPEWQAWTWASQGRGFPWLGVLLVLVGLGLLIQFIFPGVSVGTLVLLAVGLAFLAGWIFGGSWFSMIPGVLIVSLSGGRLLQELGILTGPGITSLALAAGLLIIWAVARARGRNYALALWAAALFGLIGFIQVSGRLVGIPELGAFWPVVIIVIGLILLYNARRR
jgi:hypothetical protein